MWLQTERQHRPQNYYTKIQPSHNTGRILPQFSLTSKNTEIEKAECAPHKN